MHARAFVWVFQIAETAIVYLVLKESMEVVVVVLVVVVVIGVVFVVIGTTVVMAGFMRKQRKNAL